MSRRDFNRTAFWFWTMPVTLALTAAMCGAFTPDTYKTAKKESTEQREASAAQAICGPEAAWEMDGNTVQCFTHRGYKTITAQVNK